MDTMIALVNLVEPLSAMNQTQVKCNLAMCFEHYIISWLKIQFLIESIVSIYCSSGDIEAYIIWPMLKQISLGTILLYQIYIYIWHFCCTTYISINIIFFSNYSNYLGGITSSGQNLFLDLHVGITFGYARVTLWSP